MVAMVQQQAGVEATHPTTMGAIDSGWWLGDLVVALVPVEKCANACIRALAKA